jgi:hypothetical protein
MEACPEIEIGFGDGIAVAIDSVLVAEHRLVRMAMYRATPLLLEGQSDLRFLLMVKVSLASDALFINRSLRLRTPPLKVT